MNKYAIVNTQALDFDKKKRLRLALEYCARYNSDRSKVVLSISKDMEKFFASSFRGVKLFSKDEIKKELQKDEWLQENAQPSDQIKPRIIPEIITDLSWQEIKNKYAKDVDLNKKIRSLVDGVKDDPALLDALLLERGLKPGHITYLKDNVINKRAVKKNEKIPIHRPDKLIASGVSSLWRGIKNMFS